MRSATTGPAPPRRAPIARLADRAYRWHAWPVRAVQAAGGWRQQAEEPAAVGPSTAALVATGSTPEADLVHVAFRWPAQMGGNDVHVSGSWDGWAVPTPLRASPFTGDCIAVLALPPGTHEYKFLVDGEWRAAPGEPIVHSAAGHVNHKRSVTPNVAVAFPGLPGDEVLLLGSFGGWQELVPLRWCAARGRHVARLSLLPGAHHYRLLVNGSYRVVDDVAREAVSLYDGAWVDANVMSVPPPPGFRLFYATGWHAATLVYRFVRDGVPVTDAASSSDSSSSGNGGGGWQEVEMDGAPSRARPGGGHWRQAFVPAPLDGSSSGVSLEFYVRGPPPPPADVIGGGGGGWGGAAAKGSAAAAAAAAAAPPEDRGPDGSGYVLPWAGGWKLCKGRLSKFPRAASPPILLCSDLDGTMVGDAGDAAADARSAGFADYWENEAALAGSVLVYNTGRSRGDAAYLLEEKAGCLAVPDVLITAVGTKIWHLPDKWRGFTDASDLTWVEDEAWAARLDEGWDLNAVRNLGFEAHKALNRDGIECVKWLDRGDEHRHRIALQVAASSLGTLRALLRDGLDASRVRAHVISSGTGDWRYCDVVAFNAGKLRALEWVAAMYGVPTARCVAAGDSGNDVLMLDGDMPAIIVGNAQRELLDWYTRQPPPKGVASSDADNGGGGTGVHALLRRGPELVPGVAGAGGESSLVVAGAPDGAAAAGPPPASSKARLCVTQAVQAAGILEGLARHGLLD